MNNDQSNTTIINYNDDEFDCAVAEAVELFEQHNIRFRTPNRNAKPTYQQKSRPIKDTN